jgi:quercetin dioxygenase-like cupin family protein
MPETCHDVLIEPGGGETITDREGREVVLLTGREEITITRYRIAPGERGPDPHVHHEHTDAFYVLEGEVSFILGPKRETIAMPAGSLVAARPNVIHTFLNESEGEVRFLNLHAPDGGFAALMRARRDGDEAATFDTHDPPSDGGRPVADATVSGPGEGERLVGNARSCLLKAALEEMAFIEFEIEPGYEPPGVHDHESEVDVFYVLDGELEFTVDGSRHRSGPGTLASVPPGIEHTFARAGDGPARFLNLHTPNAGFAEFLRRVSQ